jgi:putative DNA primase/helicase
MPHSSHGRAMTKRRIKMNEPHQSLNEQPRANRKHAFERSATKPNPIPLRADGIPDVLKAFPNFVLWNYTWNAEKRKWDKPPLCVNHAPASSTDAATWSSFEDALNAYEHGGFDGVGLVFTADGELVGFDFDDVRDPETGVIDSWAQGLIEELGGYAEVSPSGTGVKVIVRGKLPPGRRKFTTIGAEAYDRARYFTITGHALEGHGRVEHRQGELEAVFAKLIEMEGAAKTAKRGDANAGANGKAGGPSTTGAEPSAILTDEQLITKASNANGTGPKFQAFMRGVWSTSEYASPSEADLGFANLIVFWTDDAEQVLRIVKASGMSRDKWEREDYARYTIGKAFAGRKNRYDPNYRRDGQVHHDRDEHVEAPPRC